MWLTSCPVFAQAFLRAIQAPITTRAADLITGSAGEARVTTADIRLDACPMETGAFSALGHAKVLLVHRVAFATAGVIYNPGNVLGLPTREELCGPLGTSGRKKDLFTFSTHI